MTNSRKVHVVYRRRFWYLQEIDPSHKQMRCSEQRYDTVDEAHDACGAYVLITWKPWHDWNQAA